MKIRVLARIFFEKVKGSPIEAELLEKSKIISINSSWGRSSRRDAELVLQPLSGTQRRR